MTINEAIRQVMLNHGAPMTANEAYRAIVKAGLYEFHADNPAHIVQQQIRRHCLGLDFPSAAPRKHFKLVDQNRYWPLDQATRFPHQPGGGKTKKPPPSPSESPLARGLRELQALYTFYISELKNTILTQLKHLPPTAFETFAKRLMDVYGFHDVKVTQISGDGGIDGHGKLKVGLAHLNVAFQCKRWAKRNVQRPEVDIFRGAIQGDFEQGLFFTTSSFSQGAIEASIKRGAVPIVLVDGEAIVELMVDKSFGVQTDNLPIPSLALDLALSNEDSSIFEDRLLKSKSTQTCSRGLSNGHS